MDITSDGCDDRIDPFASCITIASACNFLVFRKTFLESQTIGIIPIHGYRPEEKHSIKVLKWIRYMANTKEIHVQHARNGGEKKIGEYRVDGYHECENGVTMVVFGTVAYNVSLGTQSSR
jgi:hypothetical protein